MTKMLVPTAGPAAAAETAEYVMNVAKVIDADVVALHVIRTDSSKDAGEVAVEIFAEAGKEFGVNVECHTCQGALIHQIVDYAEENDVDLIVMGASSGRVVSQWFSSTIRENTTVPVLVLPYQILD